MPKKTLVSRRLRALAPMFFAMALIAVSSPLVPDAAAQDNNGSSGDYIQLTVDQKLNRSLRNKIGAMLSDGFKSGDEQRFDEYYKKCVFPEWTIPGNFTTRGKDTRTPRRRLTSDLKRAQRGAVYDRLNRLVLEQMLEFAQGNYHPATRYNAMLMIGDLNAKNPVLPDPPQALSGAFSHLLSAAQNEDFPDAVRLAAVLGIIRHSKYGARNEASRQKISDFMLALATTRDVPRGRSKDAHAWFRRLALDELGRLESPGPNGAVAKVVAGILSESDTPLAVRCEAAKTLGRLDLTPQTGLDPLVVGKTLDDLLVDVAKDEVRRGKEDTDYLVNARQLKARLTDIQAAIAGYEGDSSKGILARATTPEQKKPLETLEQEIKTLLGREYLDHEDLVPRAERRPRTDERRGNVGPGAGGARPGAMGPEGYGARGPQPPDELGLGGLDGTGQLDPAKPVLEKIMAELIRLVESREKRRAGP